ncbi:bifunctional UDP-N-acetylmuramoyl-tripeptide:D-alanyl-D-alanine ligase/alanine racemase [Arundinibacter roseus]|uniref:Alanine racemase n=1 Tax=Arundinibacter roseus TaxID=2070510 RepID=A0A4R4KN11_9BACT|nr:bifunctional UDP-N-acetylmuramoyl-tripeptide:D-alanyl-D-alanine ligase/alanine racemase [Arundinibacter roseus]TDB67931.1 bifunctional UDP-N-acetylmuramoyl-tripeptide:D-alanyl-D-alanine ligase/alanine racemase [Arundinibacter roseus]
MSLIEIPVSEIRTEAHYLLTDSRQLTFADKSLFFALRGEHHDGHRFLTDVYAQGGREFVVEKAALTPSLTAQLNAWTDATVWVVANSLRALQFVAAQHRQKFSIPVVGITGSNGKTIVKEWLAQFLANPDRVVASPKSYNSQIGVPLSVWNMNETHTVALFEAGLSRPHEMEHLQPIIAPTVGIFTNIGPAHDEGFRSRKQKITEKLRLFTKVKKLIYRKDFQEIDQEISLILRPVNPAMQLLAWSTQSHADIQVQWLSEDTRTLIQLSGSLGNHQFETSYRNEATLENLTHCLVFLLDHGLSPQIIQERLAKILPVSMRLQIKEGIHNCQVIDDTYNNDLQGLTIALNFLSQQENRGMRAVILSDVLQSGQPAEELYASIAALIHEKKMDILVGIGPEITRHRSLFTEVKSYFFSDTGHFLNQFSLPLLSNSVVLVKGARSFSFEKIVHRLQQKAHGTVLEINLDALTHNLNYYRNKVGANTRLMVMVKAFAYGSGSVEVARLLQFNRVDYLAVAYADEGVALRQSGIEVPIMVMNPSPSAFDVLWEYTLEPELFSKKILTEWIQYIHARSNAGHGPGVHLKIDTGMHRLGFPEAELPWLLQQLHEHPELRVNSVFSHLVGADEGEHTPFSRLQYERFIHSAHQIEQVLGYQTLKHILNSAGIVRFPEYRLDMVRIGIGLYGVEATRMEQRFLQTVGTLKTTISQIKHVKAGDTVGYGRRGQLFQEASIATLALGYADGYDRRFGNGVGLVSVNGVLCPTVGNICMDMTMIDVTHAPAEEGDEVIVFGREVPITELAARIKTIPYELLTGVSERVRRVFYKE